jgi:hypothetical protein
MGLSVLSSVRKHNTWLGLSSYMLCLLTDDNPNHVLCFLTDDNTDNPIHSTTTCCVYWQTTTTTPTMYSVLWRTTTPTNPSIIQPHVMFTDRRQRQLQPCILFSDGRQHRQTRGLSGLSAVRDQNTWLELSLSSVSKHKMWLYYGWVCRCCRPSENRIHGWGCRCRLSVNITCGCIMDGFFGVVALQKTQYMVGVVVVVCQ